MRWPLQPLQPFQQTQLQPPFGQSVDSLCHPWFTTTNVSYRFPFLKLPPPPCAVLLVVYQSVSLSMLESICRLFGAIPKLVACKPAFSLTATLLFRYPLAPHIFEIFAYVVQISMLVNSTPFSLDGGIKMCHNICISTDDNDVTISLLLKSSNIPLVGSNPNSGNEFRMSNIFG